MDFEDFEMWMYGAMGWSHTTIQKTIQKLRFLERQGLNLKKWKRLKEETIQRELTIFFAKMRKQGKTKKTLNGYVKVLNRYLRYLGKDYKIKYFKDYSEEAISVPTDEEVRRILAVRWTHPDVNARNRAMIHLVFATGIRLSELVNLNWQDLDLMRGRLKIRGGKNEKDRTVPVPKKVLKLLEEYRKIRIPSDQNAMFTTYTGRITEGHVRNIFKKAGEKAGVKGFHIHAARHWRAIKWIDEGIDLDAVRVLLGHKNISSTQIYVRKRPLKKIFDQVRRKDKTFGGYKEEDEDKKKEDEKDEE